MSAHANRLIQHETVLAALVGCPYVPQSLSLAYKHPFRRFIYLFLVTNILFIKYKDIVGSITVVPFTFEIHFLYIKGCTFEILFLYIKG